MRRSPPRSPSLPALRLPRAGRWPKRWIAFSIGCHALALALLVALNRPHESRGTSPLLFFSVGPGPAPLPVRELRAPSAPRRARRAFRYVRSLEPGIPSRLPEEPGTDTAAGALAAPGGTGPGAGASGLLALGPRYGDGRLWVRPLMVPLAGPRRIDLDSSLAARMRFLADSIEAQPMGDPNANPYVSRPWTFRREGKTYGLDARGLHLGDFTIPTALLALLSLPQGNVDQSSANRALWEMRADLLRAAARAQTEEDFRAAVRDIRQRKDRERREAREREAGRERGVP